MSRTDNKFKLINNNDNLFELLFQHSPNLTFVLDKNFFLQQINQSFYQVTHYQKNTLLQKKLANIISHDNYQSLQEKLNKLLTDKQPFSQIIEICTANNDKLQRSFHFNVIMQTDKKITGILAVENSNEQIEQLKEKAYHLEFTDPLTKLGNRHHYFIQLENFFQQVNNQTIKGFCLLGLDFDNFKKIDNTYGYKVGDKVLKTACQRLLAISEPSDVLFRVSGTRLGILHCIEDNKSVNKWVKSILKILTKIYHVDELDIEMQVSMGIVCVPQDSQNPVETIQFCELALNKAMEYKSHSTFIIYNKKLNEQFVKKLEMEKALEKAIENNCLEAYYQPQFSLPNRKLQGFEALARWRDPKYGFISPTEFIPIAEETGLIIKVGNQILEKACQQSVLWDKKGFHHTISINISIIQIKDEHFFADVWNILRRTGVNPHNIEFEITESVVIADMQESIALLNQLKELGISIALDDFGTGYSSLSYLKEIPFDVLKIDRAFIQNIPHSPKDCAITKMILILAKELVVKVIAEGMEKEEQVLFLEKEQCDSAQGFYFSHPLEVSEANKLVDDYLLGKNVSFQQVNKSTSQQVNKSTSQQGSITPLFNTYKKFSYL